MILMTPVVAATIPEVRQAVAAARRGGQTIGLVPTMGALHAGHAALLRAARTACGYVVATIFVNPTQFGPHEDFHRYPRPLEHDLDVCRAEGVDLIFVPEVATVYPANFQTFVEVMGVQQGMEGQSRPGHFRGVATVVLKLFQMVQADVAFFGQKDGQQARLIQQMVADLNVPVEVRIAPTVREPDGLAMSSRNAYLDADQRRNAPALYAALCAGRKLLEDGERSAAAVQQLLTTRIAAIPGAVLDYAEVVDADTLQPRESLTGRVMLALAVRFGATRLIDNVLVEIPEVSSLRP